MKAIILAAGMGTRVSEKYPAKHKTLLSIPDSDNPSENIPLLVHSILLLQKHNITDITVITGYLSESIEEAILAYNVEYRFNPFYYLVESIGSLWFAVNKLENSDDILIFNGDTYFDEDLLHVILHCQEKEDPVLFIDSSKKNSADLKVTYKDNYLEQYGKELDAEPMAESLDVVLLPKAIINIFRFQLRDMLENKQHNVWWESALVDKRNNTLVKVHDIAGIYWQEIDYPKDYLTLFEHCYNKATKKTSSSDTQESSSGTQE